MTLLAAIAVVCASLLAGLVLVLRYLTASRLKDGDLEKMQDYVARAIVSRDEVSTGLQKQLNQHEERLTHLNNRTQSR